MNLPNKLTLSRIALTFVFMFMLFSKGIHFKVLSLIVFLIASLTDLLDGLIAKRTKSVTDFGKLMDPIADKVLVLAAFLAFVEMALVPGWMVVIILTREFIITGLRILALNKGRVIAASEGGKHKTVSQYLSIFAILLYLVLRDVGEGPLNFWSPQIEALCRNTIFVLVLITVVLTTVSGVHYLAKNRAVYLNAKAG